MAENSVESSLRLEDPAVCITQMSHELDEIPLLAVILPQQTDRSSEKRLIAATAKTVTNGPAILAWRNGELLAESPLTRTHLLPIANGHDFGSTGAPATLLDG